MVRIYAVVETHPSWKCFSFLRLVKDELHFKIILMLGFFKSVLYQLLLVFWDREMYIIIIRIIFTLKVHFINYGRFIITFDSFIILFHWELKFNSIFTGDSIVISIQRKGSQHFRVESFKTWCIFFHWQERDFIV